MAPTSFALCFTVYKRFDAAPVWAAWLRAAAAAGVPVVTIVHASNMASPVHDDAVNAWCAAVGAHRVPTMPTAWSCPSVVWVELAMLARARDAGASHALLLSQDCAPLVRPQRVLELCRTLYAGKSALDLYEHPVRPSAFCRAAAQNLFDSESIPLVCGAQFFVCNTQHYSRIEALARRVLERQCSNHAEWSAAAKRNHMLACDEWVLQSALLGVVGESELVLGPVVRAVFRRGSLRAASHSAAAVRKYFAQHPTEDARPLAMRKVSDPDALEEVTRALVAG